MARKCCLYSDTYKWLDIVFFSGKEIKPKASSHRLHLYGSTFRTISRTSLEFELRPTQFI